MIKAFLTLGANISQHKKIEREASDYHFNSQIREYIKTIQ